jgi:dTDP-4-amino-4,6-dideoxygalactose transaminase
MYEAGKEELEAVARLLSTQKLFRYQGPGVATECQSFEQELASFMGQDFGLLMTSGTNALVASMIAAGIGPGDEVVIPTYTFFATAAAVVTVGAIPIIVNVDESLSLCPKELAEALTDRTKAVIPVHMDGRPCDMKSIKELCLKNNLVLIEDVAQAIGGHYQGQRLGSIGDFGCYSFNQDKIISAGEGGALVCRDALAYKRAQNAHDACCVFGATLRETFDKDSVFVGGSMRVSELTGAILRVQLQRLDGIINQLRSHQAQLEKSLGRAGFALASKNCKQGDCGTSIMVRFSNPEEALAQSKRWTELGLRSLPISIRPAHAVWQWVHLLREEKFLNAKLNPYQWSSRKPRELYHPLNFHPSVERLMSTIKLSVPYSPEELEKQLAILST